MFFWIGVAIDLMMLLFKVWGNFSAADRTEAMNLVGRIRDKLKSEPVKGWLPRQRRRLGLLNRLLEDHGHEKLTLGDDDG